MYGRFSIILGSLLVSIINLIMFRNIDISNQIALNKAYANIYLYSLFIPFISISGIVLYNFFNKPSLALKNKVSLTDVLNLVSQFRNKDKVTPIILMGYMNPIENMGYKKFSKMAKLKGVDGLLIVDLPPEESKTINDELIKNDLSQIFLASPTTEDKRLETIIKYSSGYLYYVSLKGITGSSIINYEPIKRRIMKIKRLSKNKIPITVGFGIKTPDAAK